MLAAAAPYALTAGTALASYLGGKKDRRAQPQVQQHGFAAAPNEIRQGMLTGANNLNKLLVNTTQNPNDPRARAFFERYGVNPSDIFYSPELAYLQQQNPERGIQQRGVTEPYNQFQRRALENIGAEDFSQQGLSRYMQPFNQITGVGEDSLNRGYDRILAQLKGQNAAYGSRVRPGTDARFQNQLQNVEQEREKALKNLRIEEARRNLEGGLNLRNQSLGANLTAGEAIQGQNQQLLNNASLGGQFVNNPLYGQAQAYNQFAQPFLNTGMSTGPIEGRTSNLTRLGGLGQQLLNTNFGFNQRYNPVNGQPYNLTNNIAGTPWTYNNNWY